MRSYNRDVHSCLPDSGAIVLHVRSKSDMPIEGEHDHMFPTSRLLSDWAGPIYSSPPRRWGSPIPRAKPTRCLRIQPSPSKNKQSATEPKGQVLKRYRTKSNVPSASNKAWQPLETLNGRSSPVRNFLETVRPDYGSVH